MLPGQDELSSLLGNLYDAASDASLWDSFLEQIVHASGARCSVLVMHNPDQTKYSISGSWGVDPEASAAYLKYYGSVDLWAQRGFSKPAGYSCTSDELCSRGEIEGTEIYNDFMTPYGIEHGMFSVVQNNSRSWASVSLFRDASRPRFELGDVDLLDFLGPHMQRTFKLHFRFSELKARAEGLEKAFDLQLGGMVFFGQDGRIVFMNRAASDMIREHDGLLAMRDGLAAQNPTESAHLTKAILEAVSTANGKGLSAGGTVSVSRLKRPPLQIQISPIRSSQLNLSQPIAAVAFLHDPSQARRQSSEALRTLFGLTPAECRVALLLGDGHTPQAIAEMIGVTGNTVHSQMKCIFSKTGVKRQSELVRLLLTS
ncbi:MAG: helix-turn-helix transcriptional regulator [Terriglobales bacterium]